MTIVSDVRDLDGKWIDDHVKVLSEPFYDEEIQQWVALANAYGMLAIITLRVTPAACGGSINETN